MNEWHGKVQTHTHTVMYDIGRVKALVANTSLQRPGREKKGYFPMVGTTSNLGRFSFNNWRITLGERSNMLPAGHSAMFLLDGKGRCRAFQLLFPSLSFELAGEMVGRNLNRFLVPFRSG